MQMRWLRGHSRDWRPAYARKGRSEHPLRSPERAAGDGCASGRQQRSVEERQRRCHEVESQRKRMRRREAMARRRLRAPKTARAVSGGARMIRPTPQSCSRARGTSSSAIMAWTRDLRWRQRHAVGEENGAGRVAQMFDYCAFARVGEPDTWPARGYGAREAQPDAPR